MPTASAATPVISANFRRWSAHEGIRVAAIILALIMTVGESTVAYAYGFDWRHLLFALAQVICVLIMPRFAKTGAGLTLLLAAAVPLLPFQTSGMLRLSVIAAVIVLGYENTVLGALAGLAAGMMTSWSLVRMFGLPIDWMLRPSQLMNLAYYLGFTVLGVALRHVAAAQRLRSALELSRLRERTAARLHNRICNDLTSLVLRIDRCAGDQTTATTTGNGDDPDGPDDVNDAGVAELMAVRAGLVETLGDVRQVIASLQTDTEQESNGLNRADDFNEELQRRIQHQRQRLEGLGIHGDVLCADADGELLSAEGRDLALEAVDELFGNIARYASPEVGYTFVAQRDATTLTISVADTPRHNAMTGNGSGMARLRQSVEAIGGSCAVESSPGTWFCQLRIPYA
ncbi:hypothetical protein [Bifidobacterium oedipodis]|uniref:Histidine kinase n=1 Tax=Bifidobacterium oedipodis TaxID=2675322 RepID=A0A7Y0ERQ1_9BIFI|nr:hypothetical protein [Bifidobacterium sp. DSM 109957]NMM95196.1 hypothetical protein [Bifidobacterium sp. DSM 109957]